MSETPPQVAFAGSTVRVNLSERAYDIDIATGQWEQFPQRARQWLSQHSHWDSPEPQTLIVTDENVRSLFAERVWQNLRSEGWRAELLTVPAGEASKSFAQTQAIYDQLVEMRADRKTVVMAVGGGVVGDLAGFAAATYARGLPFVQVPTTLLADVDSSVGGKTGINHPRGKNLIGAFHQPLGVFINMECLRSLPDRDYRSGLAEVVKYGVILDEPFFDFLTQNFSSINTRDPAVLAEIVARCCRLKADVVEADEFERSGLRAILNYGHTFAHAYEALCGYGELMHGEAVAIGMMDACVLAERLGMVPATVTQRQHDLLTGLHLPVRLPGEQKHSADDYLTCMQLDKKTVAGQLRFILPTRIGQVKTVTGVPASDVSAVLERD